jgi:hypothetical protein
MERQSDPDMSKYTGKTQADLVTAAFFGPAWLSCDLLEVIARLA